MLLGPDRGVLVGSILELNHRQRQTVDEDNYIWSPVELAILVGGFDRELIDGQPVVVLDVLEIHQVSTPADRAPILRFVFYFDATQQHVMEGVVIEQERRLA